MGSAHSQVSGSCLRAALLAFTLFLSPLAFSGDDYHEVPGKTVLYPYHELYNYNFKEHPFRIRLKHDELTFVSLSQTIKIELNKISELTLVKEVPRLRGKLLNEFDQDDLSFLSKIYLRISETKNDGSEHHHFITLDFNIKTEDELKALREDIRQVNDLHLKTSIIVRDYETIFNLNKDHRRDFQQYPFLTKYRGNLKIYREFFKNLEHELIEASHKNYHTEKNHMAMSIFSALDETIDNEHSVIENSGRRSRLFRSPRNRNRYERLYKDENKENIWRVAENLKLRNMPFQMQDFKRRRLRDEFCSSMAYSHLSSCAGNFTGQLLFRNNLSQLNDRYLYIEDELNDIRVSSESFAKFLSKRSYEYIHKGEEDRLDEFMLKIVALDEYILQTIDLAKKSKHESFLDIENNLKRVRIVLWSRFSRIIIRHNDYAISRFFDEGHFYKAYADHSFRNALEFVKREKLTVLPFNWAIVDMSELADDTELEDFLSDDEISYGLDHLVANKLESTATNLGEGLVNILGQVFKKRAWIPYLRISSNFRDNYMTSRRDYVYKHLFAADGMKPGDIILEKDLQANTDVLIPGYWVHAALYLGSINDLKKMGLWDDPKMAVIRYEIEEYRRSSDRQYYLNDQWGNDFAFDDIPWFYESDRPGVGVHPLHKFMKTDGMAVLRPTSHYDNNAIAEVFYRANERMYFPYDYVHNVRNKFSVSCSKVILKIFDKVSFPVTQYLSYLSVSPDQIGQPVSLDPQKADYGELKLVMFFDAEKEGDLRFHYNRPDTYDFYPKYLEFTGVK